jgi:hypothetical protein
MAQRRAQHGRAQPHGADDVQRAQQHGQPAFGFGVAGEQGHGATVAKAGQADGLAQESHAMSNHTDPAIAIATRVEDLLAQMTLEEKIGQLTQVSGNLTLTGPLNVAATDRDGLRQGRVGSMLNVLGTRYTRGYQEEAMQSRLKIPLLFAHDVIHGYLTTFPVPLAEAASFDLAAIERSARVAATEAAAAGIHWTFAPMVDLTRDPRWGRVTEGAGEDPYLASQIAAARVRGLQGRRRGDTDAVLGHRQALCRLRRHGGRARVRLGGHEPAAVVGDAPAALHGGAAMRARRRS